ncbi:flavodoxin domain-containing protein [Cupriavidus basilensis]|uniref:flavodoxin domain-containing protein n=1 Tax=Cupriavidus basilensis TaxID=68895 RepID=UPI0020A62D10|nr:flavodoxin domain-containing protein [Cupriavidus basilensis]MCP3018326.1 flavodoxin domain-containing protein [Cupriavidus basilensis]
MDSVLILFGTQSGNAAMVAETIKSALERAGVRCELAPENGTEPDLIARQQWLLVCCSTHGDGDVPDHMLPLVDAIGRECPDLSSLRYGVIALGDRTYSDTFCFGGKRIDSLLRDRGAQRVGERLEVDASTQPFADEVALAWLQGWIEQARKSVLA